MRPAAGEPANALPFGNNLPEPVDASVNQPQPAASLSRVITEPVVRARRVPGSSATTTVIPANRPAGTPAAIHRHSAASSAASSVLADGAVEVASVAVPTDVALSGLS